MTLRITGTDAYGNAVNDTATTGVAGGYKFWNRSPADGAGYTITETHPAAYADGQENAGGASVVGGSHATDVISSIALAADEDKVRYDFGELPADLEVVSKVPSIATVSLRQPFDYTIIVQNNGPASATNSTLADTLPAGIKLTGTPTTAPVHTCTGVAGDGSFTCDFGTMATSDSITVTVPVILETIPGAVASMTNTATASTDRNEVTLANNSKDGTVNVVTSSLNCVVYQDYNNNGIKDGGEPGIGGVLMTLTGIDDYGNDLAPGLTTTTAPNGSCAFNDLSPSTIAGTGGGYTLTETQPAGFTDGKENDSGTVGETGNVMTPIDLAADTNLPTHQFGERPPTGLSGTVWCDDNNNGTIDGAEATRIAGVTINLTGPTSDTTVTDPNGYYHFEDLIPGDYSVTQIQNTAHACNLPGLASSGTVEGNPQGTADNVNASVSYGNVISNITIAATGNTSIEYNFGELRPASLAGVVYNDTDRSDDRQPGEPGIAGVTMTLTCSDYRGRAVGPIDTITAADGTYSFPDLLPTNPGGCIITETHPAGYLDGIDVAGNLGGTVGPDEVIEIVLASGAIGTGYDFAEQSAGLSGYVYVDTDDDGVKDAGELPIAGVAIELSGTDADGPVSHTTTTDANGYYLFTGLSPSVGAGYTVTETTQPSAWADGKDTAGNVGGSVVNDEISEIVLVATDFAINYNFGELGGSLAGSVYTDLDNDGQRDGTEAGIPGVQMTLQCTNVNGTVLPARTTNTIADGSYLFEDVQATSGIACQINEATPPNTTDGLDRVGTLGGTLGNDVLSAIPVAPGEDGTGYDFGEILSDPATVAGTVWHDGNHDRVDNDAQPQEGWSVELIIRDNPSVCSSDHVLVATQNDRCLGQLHLRGCLTWHLWRHLPLANRWLSLCRNAKWRHNRRGYSLWHWYHYRCRW